MFVMLHKETSVRKHNCFISKHLLKKLSISMPNIPQLLKLSKVLLRFYKIDGISNNFSRVLIMNASSINYQSMENYDYIAWVMQVVDKFVLFYTFILIPIGIVLNLIEFDNDSILHLWNKYKINFEIKLHYLLLCPSITSSFTNETITTRFCTAPTLIFLVRDALAVMTRTIIPFCLMFIMNSALIFKIKESKRKVSKKLNHELIFVSTVIGTTLIFVVVLIPNIIWIAFVNYNRINPSKQKQTYGAFLFLFEKKFSFKIEFHLNHKNSNKIRTPDFNRKFHLFTKINKFCWIKINFTNSRYFPVKNIVFIKTVCMLSFGMLCNRMATRKRIFGKFLNNFL
ncbi:hypothetical protein BpHYR1_005673 [Brachionus plicatilis]|uniref:Uncharacterized protein n=1 Tax=Brachionus plicatilis TaxID=10195 RepID=A0A3M7PK11_BRAPC|nr:hypothetical protein BpHYR1_005673 [Brachionus plicatilis]